MDNPLIRKLAVATELKDKDRAVLERLCRHRRAVGAKQDLYQQGDRPEIVHLVMEGVAVRYKMMPGGRRQIMAVLLPGDFCDLHVSILDEMDHGIATITPCIIVDIPAASVHELTAYHPCIAHALHWVALVDMAVLREWLASHGRRNSIKRMAHFFCEMLIRLQTVGLADENSYSMPLRQNDFADIFGITSIHANRIIQSLREDGLVILERRHLTIFDVDKLKALCSFDASYLHLTRRKSISKR